MMSDLELFARRLKQARILKKLSMEQLCSKMEIDITKQAISKYESAKMMPSSTILVAMAEALEVELDYFFRPFTIDIDKLQVSFRKKSDASAKDVSAMKIQIMDDIERYLEIEEILGKEPVILSRPESSPITNAEQMRECARKVRQNWALGNDAIANVQDILEEHGIKVILTEASNSFDGVSGIVNGKHHVIVLNKNQEHVERRRFTALHELGHLLYNDCFADSLSAREREILCDNFANEMLVPSSTIAASFKSGDKISTSELKAFQTAYGISISALMVKIHQLQIMSDSRYKSYCIRVRSDEHLREFVEKSRYRENLVNRFETMVYSAAAKDMISTSKAASLLRCPITRVRKNLNIV